MCFLFNLCEKSLEGISANSLELDVCSTYKVSPSPSLDEKGRRIDKKAWGKLMEEEDEPTRFCCSNVQPLCCKLLRVGISLTHLQAIACSHEGLDEPVEQVHGVHHGLGGLEDLAVERGLDVLLEME